MSVSIVLIVWGRRVMTSGGSRLELNQRYPVDGGSCEIRIVDTRLTATLYNKTGRELCCGDVTRDGFYNIRPTGVIEMPYTEFAPLLDLVHSEFGTTLKVMVRLVNRSTLIQIHTGSLNLELHRTDGKWKLMVRSRRRGGSTRCYRAVDATYIVRSQRRDDRVTTIWVDALPGYNTASLTEHLRSLK